MKERKFLTAKNIIIGLIALILIGASVAGVAVYLNDKGEATATTEQGDVENLPITGNNEENANPAGEDGDTESGDSTIPTVPGQNNNQTTGTQGGTTQGGVSTPTTEEIIQGIEGTVVEKERKIYEDLKLSWTTISIPTKTANIGIYKPELKVEKTATSIIRTDKTEEVVDANNAPMVRPGDLVIYTIRVANVGNYKATDVTITETLDVMFDGKEIKAGEPVVTIKTLDCGKVAILKVAYEVTQADIEATEVVNQVEVPKNIENKIYVSDGNIEQQDDDFIILVNPDIADITGTKTWDDSNNKDGKRPENITINLLANGEKVQSKNITKEDNWKWTFTNLPKYAEDGTEIVYTIEEEPVENYITTINGYDVTNTHIPETMAVSGSKTWDDNNDQDGIRPASITINLLADGEEVESKTVTEADGWKWEFTGLAKYEDGKEIVYTITEDTVSGYSVNIDKYDVTNTHTPETITVSVHKGWDTPYITTHPAVTVQLYQNDAVYGEPVTLSSTSINEWAHEWTVPKYSFDQAGELIENVYRVQETGIVSVEQDLSQYIITYDDNVNEKSITNTARGIVETISYVENVELYKRPVDVVLVLDTSGSMAEENSQGNSRAKDMVTAVNETITTIMKHNPLSKVAVVTYSGDATTILPLGRYEALTSDTTDPQNPIGHYLKCDQGSWNSNSKKYSDVSISTNVNGFNPQNTVDVEGATYIQSGIARGANILIENETPYREVQEEEGTTEVVYNIPVLLLLSDGEPTEYTTSYDNVGNPTVSYGNYATNSSAKWTIKTAVAYKAKIAQKYNNEAHMYTIGYGVDSLLLRTVLDPSKENIEECRDSYWFSYTRALYNDLSNEGNVDYADGSYAGKMDSAELATLLNKFIHSVEQSIISTTHRIFTPKEIEDGRVYLENIDADKEFSLSYGDTTYVTLDDAENVVVKDNGIYYVDLDAIGTDEQIHITYHRLNNQ